MDCTHPPINIPYSTVKNPLTFNHQVGLINIYNGEAFGQTSL